MQRAHVFKHTSVARGHRALAPAIEYHENRLQGHTTARS